MIRNSTAEDVTYVVQHMRPEDIKELWLASGKSAVEAVAAIGEQPYVSFTLCKDDEPVAIFGATIVPETGVATMFRFATRRWPEVVREAIKAGRRGILPMFAKAGVKKLRARAYCESDTKWLKLFGARYLGNDGTLFRSFELDLAA